MSLRVDDGGGGRSRSKSRERSRSRQRGTSPNPTAKSSKDSGSRKSRDKDAEKIVPSADGDDGEPEPQYQVRTPKVTPGLSSFGTGALPAFLRGKEGSDDEEEEAPSRSRGVKFTEDDEPPTTRGRGVKFTEDDKSSRHQRDESQSDEDPRYTMRPAHTFPLANARHNSYSSPISPKASSSSRSVPYPEEHSGMPAYPDDRVTGFTAMPSFPTYANPPKYEYAKPPEQLSYSDKSQAYTREPGRPHQPARSYSGSQTAVMPKPIVPGATAEATEPAKPKPERRSTSEAHYEMREPSAKESSTRESSKRESITREPASRDPPASTRDPPSSTREPSATLAPKMSRLSVNTGAPEKRSLDGGGAPPASPLLEAYHGTYQSMSPMPSPMMLPADDMSDIEDLESLTPSSTRGEGKGDKKPKVKLDAKGKRRVMIYDSEGDADQLAKAMSHSTARPGPLIEILPGLTHDQLLELRDQYKKRCQIQGRGVNISKHIKVKTTGNFGKICYVTSLGKWESEAYWANFWYQSHSSSRELLIEALMGRPNADIRNIKDSFKDKRYNDSLSKCMEKELKPDKFRTAILMALEEQRQEETDAYPVEYRNRDVEVLRRALKTREGGESAILQVVVLRSDNHLREVLKTYEKMYEENFAREALRKSNNLVGEVIAHILNGVINRPARDSLLLRHALDDIQAKNRAVELRYELLMSRLIRLHWDHAHLSRVKDEYKKKYRHDLETDIEEITKGDFGDFCLKLCEI